MSSAWASTTRSRSLALVSARLQAGTYWSSTNEKGDQASEIENPRDLFLHELGDILYVERSLAEEALPRLIDEVQTQSSRQASRSTSSRPSAM
jgi:hypothetical protein